jgi:DNA-binding transcriptional LysR family regulator
MKDNRLTEMQVFRMLVECGGFTAAAHALGVSQSSVSQTISGIESRLGVRLLNRSTREQRLTAHGERYFAHCKKVISQIDEEEAQLASSSMKLDGELRITAPLSFGLDQIAPRLPMFQALHPDLKVSLSLSDSLVSLIEENVDVAIRMGKLQDSSLVSRKLCDLQRIVAASPVYLDRQGTPVRPRDLQEHNCLLWDETHKHLNRWPFLVDGQLQQISVDGSFRSNNGQTLFAQCLAGVGLARGAEHVLLPAIHDKRLVRLLAEYEARDDTAIYIVYLADRKLAPKIRAYADYLIEWFREPPWLEYRQ